MDVIVVGGGVTGLTIALQCLRQGKQVIVMERQPVVGGLCRSYRYGDFSFDIGPHRLFSSNPVVDDFFTSILGEAYVDTPRVSQVRLDGRLHNWPLTLSSIRHLSPRLLMGCCIDLFVRRGDHREAVTLEDYVLAKYGKTIYEVFWKEYTRKFLGLSCDKIDAEWGALSITRSVIDKRKHPDDLWHLALSSMRKATSDFRFRYPTGGMGAFPEALAAAVVKEGGQILVGEQVSAVNATGGRIQEIHTSTARYAVDQLVWTGALTEISSLLGQGTPALEYLDIRLFNLAVEGTNADAWQWMYFPDKDTVFSRISRPNRFYEAMSPPGTTSLCVEVSCTPDRTAPAPTASLQERVYDDLVATGVLASTSGIIECHEEHVKNAYPIYRLGFRGLAEAAKKRLKVFSNLHLAGRMAQFEHDNIDEAIASAMAFPALFHQESARGNG